LESVLRAKPGQSIELLDGQGSVWECLITGISRGRVSVSLIGKLNRPERESPLAITLGLAIARPDTMDLIVRQATEMGVLRLAVFRAARSQYGFSERSEKGERSGKTAEKKKDRWFKIASEAVCQCGRTRVPETQIFDDLTHFLTFVEDEKEAEGPHRPHTLKIFALEHESCSGLLSLRGQMGPDIRRVLAVLGPEGGWDKTESSALIEAGFTPVCLGPRILRVETAAVALVSSIQLQWGDVDQLGITN